MSNHLLSFFIEGQFLGTGSRPHWHPRGDPYPAKPLSYAFFCENCGEIWARVVVEGQTRFCLWSVRCRKHEAYGPNCWQLPGSIWLDWEPDYVTSFPLPVLMRELQLHLEHYDRFEQVIEPVPGY